MTKMFNFAQLLSYPKSKSRLCNIFIAAFVIFGAYFIGSALLGNGFRERLLRWENIDNIQKAHFERTESNNCKTPCRRPIGSEALPEGIVVRSSNLEMRPLWGSDMNNNVRPSMNLLAMPVGIKQEEAVNRIVVEFLSSNFVVMLFHYDGAVNEWSRLGWSDRVIHVSGFNQTKWWFAKRFLHPDIVAEYGYVFLWDEDLGVENFDPQRYLSIVKDEGLEISQPALDRDKSRIHHQITARLKRLRLHRRIFKQRGGVICDASSTAPPCVGWVEMMAPVFSRDAWRCAWYMIQNDLIHAWGLDFQLGYCALGDRTKNVGVVDSEYIVHLDFPTLGAHTSDLSPNIEAPAPSEPQTIEVDNRSETRKQSFLEMQIFKQRWNEAAKNDKCWVDPYQQKTNHSERH